MYRPKPLEWHYLGDRQIEKNIPSTLPTGSIAT